MKILVLNGPNLNFLGIREPAIYGSQTYDNLIAKIKELAPQAEIVIQQTWSYNAADPRLNPGTSRSWKIDQTGMYEKLTAAYLQLAEKAGILKSEAAK